MRKTTIDIQLDVTQKSLAKFEATADKMFIDYTLLHTLPDVNSNGETFEPEATRNKVESIVNGYINLEHEPWQNVGSVLDATYIETDNGGDRIDCQGVLWKSVLSEYLITPEEVKNGTFRISMEVLYKDWHYLVGEERYDKVENEHLEEFVGATYDGKYVSRVIIPYEFTGCALVVNPADKKAEIKEAIASKQKEENNMFKKFETEELYNEHIDDFKESYASELKEDEEFVNSLREGYVSVASVVEKFDGIVEGEDLDGLSESVASVVDNYKELKTQYENEKTIASRKEKLSVASLTIDDLGLENEERLLEVDNIDMVISVASKVAEKTKKSNASVDEKEEETFDPNINLGEDLDMSDIINAL